MTRVALQFLVIIAFCSVAGAQVSGRGTGTCSQLINGKYHQVPCAQPPENEVPPPAPTEAEIAAERLRVAKEAASKASKDGLLALDRGAWEEAITKFSEAIKLEPDNKAHRRNLERAESEWKNHENLRKLSAARRDAENADAVTKLSSFRDSLLQDDSRQKLARLNESLANESDTGACPPSRGASVVDLCRREKEIVDFVAPPDSEVGSFDLEVIKGMLELAKTANWSEIEQKRLMKSLYELEPDGEWNVGTEEIARTWKEIEKRKMTPSMLRAIRAAKGVTLDAMGKQSLNDCAVFTLANATRRPYGFIAAMATRLVREGSWWTDEERANPGGTIKKFGLLNYEVVFLAESLGQAEIVSSANFEKTIRSGRPVMIGMTFNGKSGHEVVLAKTFRVKGEPWFEMIDSNQAGFRKLYLSQSELARLLLEKGVAFTPDSARTPALLR